MEALPFLLLGTLTSGLVEVFISRERMLSLIPRNRYLATAMGGAMGFVFPVCECGVVPLTRRLFTKGFPITAGIAFLLAAPIINPITLASTYAAYGWSEILVGRFVLGLLIPIALGLIFFRNAQTLRTQSVVPISGGADDALEVPVDLERVRVEVPPAPSLAARLRRSLRIAADETFSMGKYLVAGCIMAALMQTFVPQSALLELGSGPVLSVIVMQVLAFVLSVCSTVDAFISLAFVNTFTTGSILAFLVFGPMVDIKSTMMFLGVFPRRTVAMLVVLPFVTVALVTILINLFLA
ncbi:MAG: permease [Chloroflexi bacterium]|nr:permease [Chloroflexota bacterium]